MRHLNVVVSPRTVFFIVWKLNLLSPWDIITSFHQKDVCEIFARKLNLPNTSATTKNCEIFSGHKYSYQDVLPIFILTILLIAMDCPPPPPNFLVSSYSVLIYSFLLLKSIVNDDINDMIPPPLFLTSVMNSLLVILIILSSIDGQHRSLIERLFPHFLGLRNTGRYVWSLIYWALPSRILVFYWRDTADIGHPGTRDISRCHRTKTPTTRSNKQSKAQMYPGRKKIECCW